MTIYLEQCSEKKNKLETVSRESCKHNQIFDLQPKTCCFGIDICLLFFVSIVRTTGMNMSLERQGIAN